MNWQIRKKAPQKVRVDNLTRGQNLVIRGQAAANIVTRLRGLIGRPPLSEGEGLLILPCKSIHTHFMSYPIDVLYVDRRQEIVAIDQAMTPWRVGRIHRRARFVLEMPAGTVATTGTETGDRLHIKGVSGLGQSVSPLML